MAFSPTQASPNASPESGMILTKWFRSTRPDDVNEKAPGFSGGTSTIRRTPKLLSIGLDRHCTSFDTGLRHGENIFGHCIRALQYSFPNSKRHLELAHAAGAH